MGTLLVNGKKIATGWIEKMQFAVFPADESADVGADDGTPVTEAYKVPFKFTGKIAKVTIELQEMKANIEAERYAVRCTRGPRTQDNDGLIEPRGTRR